jgi:hypothetical protein
MIRRRGLIDAQASWPTRVPWNRPGSGSAESREIRILASTSEMVARGRKEEVEVLAGKKTETRRNVSPHVTFPGNTLVS